jgi:hypothetical protein
MTKISGRLAGHALTRLGAASVALALIFTGAARAQSCTDESSVKSAQTGNAAVALSFRNASSERRRLYWLDQNGERKFYAIVEPQHIFQQSSYPGFAWLITDDGENCLSIVTATAAPMTVDIGGAASAQVVPPPPGQQEVISQVQPDAVAAPAAEPDQVAIADQAPQAPDVSPIEQFQLNGSYRLIPPGDPKKALNNESSGRTEITRVKPNWASAKWTFEEVPGTPYVRIKNDWKHTYLNDDNGKLRSVFAKSDAEESQWSFEPVDGTTYVQLRNAKTENYLLTVDGEPALAEHIPEKHENRSYWDVVSASQADAQPVAAIDNDYTEALADCRAIGGIWTGSSCRAQREEVLTCPRGWRWSRRAGECQWAGRGDCPPWQRRNGRCLTQLTCRGGVVRQSGRGLSCHCPPGMAAWGNYPRLKCVPSLARIVPLLLQGKLNSGNRQGKKFGNKGPGNRPGKFGGQNQFGGVTGNKGPFNGKNGSPQQGGTQQGNGKTTTTTVVDPRTGNKTVTKTVVNPKTGIATKVQVITDKKGRPLSITRVNTPQGVLPPPIVKVVRPQIGKNGKGTVQAVTPNNAATLKAQQDAIAKANALKAQQDAAAKANALKGQQNAIAKANALKAQQNAIAKANALKAQQDAAAKANALKAQQDAAAKANALKAQQNAIAKANALKAQQDAAAKANALKAQQNAIAKANALKAQQNAIAKANAIKAQQNAAAKAKAAAAAKAAQIKAQQQAAAKAAQIRAQQAAAKAAAQAAARTKAPQAVQCPKGMRPVNGRCQ